jgi:hypothetical protein
MGQSFLSEVKRLEHVADDQVSPSEVHDEVIDAVVVQENDNDNSADSNPEPANTLAPEPTNTSAQSSSAETITPDSQEVQTVPVEQIQEPDGLDTQPMTDAAQSNDLTPDEAQNVSPNDDFTKVSLEDTEDSALEAVTNAVGEEIADTRHLDDPSAADLPQATIYETNTSEPRAVDVEVVEAGVPDSVAHSNNRTDKPVASTFDRQPDAHEGTVINAQVVSSDIDSSTIDVAPDDISTFAETSHDTDDGEDVSDVSDASDASDTSRQLKEALTQLEASQHREAKLNERIRELETQVLNHQNAVRKLELDLEVIQASKKELLADLAEAKRYILQLTTIQQPPESTNQGVSASSQSANASASNSSEQVEYSAQGRSPAPMPAISFQAKPIRPTKHPSVKPLSSAPLNGLPPMSTERLQAAPIVPSKTRHSSPPVSRPSHVEKRPKVTASSASSATPPSQDSESQGVALQKAYRRPLVQRDRPLPEAARDTRRKVPKPKLSDSEISWFD